LFLNLVFIIIDGKKSEIEKQNR